MIKVVPYIQTIGSEAFKNFISLPFSINLLYSVTAEEGINVIFDEWHGKNMGTYYKFNNEEKKIILEFYVNHYDIINGKTIQVESIKMPLPKTINDFINDMNRFGVQLYWTEWIDQNFEPKDYLAVDKIKEYFTHLLIKMQKEQDLD